jgi:hypothetical protein
MHFKLEMDTENDAFRDGLLGVEIAHCLNRVASRAELGELEGTVRDTNGNTVGHWALTESVRFEPTIVR